MITVVTSKSEVVVKMNCNRPSCNTFHTILPSFIIDNFAPRMYKKIYRMIKIKTV